MKNFIVVSDGFDSNLFEMLQQHPTFEVHPKSKLSSNELEQLLPKANALVVRSATKPNKQLIDQAPNLKYIIRAGAGTDNIDKKYCQEVGVKVSNTPGANNNSAAEHAIALMFTVLRNTAWAHASMKDNRWDKAAFMGSELSGKKIGIVGFGNIGKIVAKRLEGFEPEILYFDPNHKKSELAYAKAADSIEDLFKECDIITIHTPLVESTKNLVNKELLLKMKKSAVLINCARGGIVNEQDLYDVLSEKKILGAGFDVYATEPLEENSQLRQLDNLVLTPHLGASTKEAQYRVGQMAVNQLIEFFDNNNLLNEVRG